MSEITVIGAGFMGEHHVHAVADHLALDLHGVVDIDAELAETLATRYDAERAYTDYEPAIQAADGVIVATPEAAHAEQAHAVLDAGKHLLLEKPITEDLSTARQLAERAAETDHVTGVSFVLRYDPAYTEVHSRVRDGELGMVVAARAMRGITVGESRRIGPRGHPNFYMSVHDIDAILACVDGTVEAVAANERSGRLSNVDVPDAVQAILRFDTGASAVVEGYGVLPDDVPGGIIASLEVVGTDGNARIETPGNALEVTADGFDRPDTRHWPVVNDEMDGTVARQIDRFAKAMAGEAPMEATIEDGYEAQVVAEGIRRAAERGDVVDLAELR